MSHKSDISKLLFGDINIANSHNASAAVTTAAAADKTKSKPAAAAVKTSTPAHQTALDETHVQIGESNLENSLANVQSETFQVMKIEISIFDLRKFLVQQPDEQQDDQNMTSATSAAQRLAPFQIVDRDSLLGDDPHDEKQHKDQAARRRSSFCSLISRGSLDSYGKTFYSRNDVECNNDQQDYQDAETKRQFTGSNLAEMHNRISQSLRQQQHKTRPQTFPYEDVIEIFGIDSFND